MNQNPPTGSSQEPPPAPGEENDELADIDVITNENYDDEYDEPLDADTQTFPDDNSLADEVQEEDSETSPELFALANAQPGEFVDHVKTHRGQTVHMPNRFSVSNTLPRRTMAEKERDLVTIAEFYLKGMSHQHIADELTHLRGYSIKRSTVQKDIAELYRRWQNSYLTSINELKVRELARIDRLEAEYWKAWERSTRDFASVRQDRISDETMMKNTAKDENGKTSYTTVLKPSFIRTKTTTKKEERVGSAAFLEGVERCIRMRIEVLGLEPAKSVNINWRKQAEAEGINPEGVVNGLVEQFVAAAAAGLDGSSSSRSLGEGPGPD